jgi:sulfate permease, SulP family
MDAMSPGTAAPAPPRFAELFTPKLVTVLREGYRLRDLRADALAGLTVAIVALPLSMALRWPPALHRSAASTLPSSADF